MLPCYGLSLQTKREKNRKKHVKKYKYENISHFKIGFYQRDAMPESLIFKEVSSRAGR
jgi:hypothetical protein